MSVRTGGSRIRVLVVDDHPVVRAGLIALLASDPVLEVIGEAACASEAVARHCELDPDVTLIDLSLPDGRGTEVIRDLLGRDSEGRFVVLSVYTGREDVYRAMKAGALGYLGKDADGEEILAAVRAAATGRRYLSTAAAESLSERIAAEELTQTEQRVLQLLARGLRNREIGAALHVTEGTIKTHVANILRKMRANSRSEAIWLAFQRRMIQPTR